VKLNWYFLHLQLGKTIWKAFSMDICLFIINFFLQHTLKTMLRIKMRYKDAIIQFQKIILYNVLHFDCVVNINNT
jgi:hypothetical protein